MKIQLNIHYRPFTSHEERKDAGYYTDLNNKRKATIEVDNGEPVLEQVLTVFHEQTHHLFDFLCQYEPHPETKKIQKRSNREALKEQWKKEVRTVQRRNKTKEELLEEIICIKIERAVKRILKKEIPADFKEKFFPDRK